MKYTLLSHCAGETSIPGGLRKEVESAIAAITVKPALGVAPKMRDAFLGSLKVSGWSSEIAVAQGSDMTITSIKNEIGLCLQTGNMARMYADLMKLQTLYLNNAIKSAVIVVPSEPVAKLIDRRAHV